MAWIAILLIGCRTRGLHLPRLTREAWSFLGFGIFLLALEEEAFLWSGFFLLALEEEAFLRSGLFLLALVGFVSSGLGTEGKKRSMI